MPRPRRRFEQAFGASGNPKSETLPSIRDCYRFRQSVIIHPASPPRPYFLRSILFLLFLRILVPCSDDNWAVPLHSVVRPPCKTWSRSAEPSRFPGVWGTATCSPRTQTSDAQRDDPGRGTHWRHFEVFICPAVTRVAEEPLKGAKARSSVRDGVSQDEASPMITCSPHGGDVERSQSRAI